MEKDTSGKWRWLLTGALFALCVAPTYISYRPYTFSWDDADYLQRAVAASRAFWGGDLHGLGAAVVSWHTPAMTLLGLPWGPLASRDAAGNCFFTLAALLSLLAASSLYMLVRIGVRPLFLVLASLCVGMSLGPFPRGVHADQLDAHAIAAGFMADSLLAWVALTALLLIPFERKAPCPSIKAAVVRGVFCASIMSLGVLTKANFLYFAVLLTPILFLVMLRHSGRRIALAWLVTLLGWSAPSAFYLLRYGRSALAQAKAASFGGLASFYHVPLFPFLSITIRESPGLVISFVLVTAALIYVVITRRRALWNVDFLAFLVAVGFLVIVLASPSKQSRYLFPVIVALPFLAAILVSEESEPAPASSVVLVAGAVFLGLVTAAVPTRGRINWQSLNKADAVLTMAARCNARSILLATDSPKLNVFLMGLDLEFSAPGTSAGTLAYQAMNGIAIEDDFRTIMQSDMIVFQDAGHINPRFTNQRVPQYERYVRESNSDPIRVGGDISVYSMGCPH